MITSVHHSGKSKLLEALKAYIQKNNVDANIIHINFNLPEYDTLSEYKELYDYVNLKYQDDKRKLCFY